MCQHLRCPTQSPPPPQNTICDPKPGDTQSAMAETPRKHPTAAKPGPQQSIVCQVRGAVLEHRNMRSPRPPWGWSQENLVLRIPVPLTVGITPSGGDGRGLGLLPPATCRGDTGQVSHGSCWRPWWPGGGQESGHPSVSPCHPHLSPPDRVSAFPYARIKYPQRGPLVGGHTTGDDPLFQPAPHGGTLASTQTTHSHLPPTLQTPLHRSLRVRESHQTP